MDPESRPQERRIVVGVDFGTTYSGVAWAEAGRPERRVTTVTSWPGAHCGGGGEESDKVPTRLRYCAGEEVQWGFEIPVEAPAGEVVEWFKLDLEPSLQSMKQEITRGPTDRAVDTVMEAYLSALMRHLTHALSQSLGPEALSSARLDLVVAVPALWSGLAKDRTRHACQLAASRYISPPATVRLVSEPEAAATYVLQGLEPRGLGLGLGVGDTVVVVDAGGGTVDVISYEIEGLEPRLAVREVAPGTGALCGSAFLDMRFAKYLRGKLGGEGGFDGGVLARAVEHFETKIKRSFTIRAPPGETYPVPVPGLADNPALPVAAGHYALPASDLRAIFEPVILETTRLVGEHVSSLPAAPRAVLLVGGLGASAYLRERLRMALDDGVEVVQPAGAWGAVGRGAAMRGLEEGWAGERVAGRHHGMVCRARYDEGAHAGIRGGRHWCGLDGCYKVFVMEWFLKRGQTVSETTPFETTFLWTGPVSNGRARTIKMDIHAHTGTPSGPAPPSSPGPAAELLCRVEADLGAVPESELERRRGVDGRWYYDLRCGIEAVFALDRTLYTLIYKGQRYDTVTTEYV